MKIAVTLGYILSGSVITILFIVGIIMILTKNSLYGKTSVLIPIISYTLTTIIFGAGLIYVLYNQILSDDPDIQINGVKIFIGGATTLLVLSAMYMYFILQAQATINVQSFNFFASFLIFQFCLMTTIVTVINKIRSFD